MKDGFRLPRQLVGEGALFMLEVTGDSMINADAMINAGAMVWLIPQNPAYTPIPGDEATILGRVVAVLRGV